MVGAVGWHVGGLQPRVRFLQRPRRLVHVHPAGAGLEPCGGQPPAGDCGERDDDHGRRCEAAGDGVDGARRAREVTAGGGDG